MTLPIEDRECTETCRSVEHGDIICASFTKRCVSEDHLWRFVNFVCCCCESVKDSAGRLALHVAASCGKTEIIRSLCEHKHFSLNAPDSESGYTALHRSVFYGKIDAAVCLMKLGANISATDSDGLTVLEHAMYDQKFAVAAEDGEIYVWGSNTNNTLGPQQARSVPEIMDIFHRENPNAQIKQVCLSRFHCAIVAADGAVFSCGHGQGGRLGLSTEHAVLAPKAVKFNTNGQAGCVVCVKASIAQDHSVFLTDAGHIWTCGLNTHKVLGFAPPPSQLLAPRPLHSFPNPVEGVLALKYHTIAWCSGAIYSWGLHAGQLGHDKSKNKYVVTPKQIPNFCSGKAEIKMVAGSTGATAFLTSAGDVYVLHEYQCRKIAGKQLNAVQLSVIGGKLDAAVESGVSSDYHTLKICVLTSAGTVLMWQENDQHLLRCIFSVNRLIIVRQLHLNINHLLIVTKDGEAFEGIVKERRRRTSESEPNISKSAFHRFLEKDDCRLVKVTKIPKIHRAVSIESDLEGKNYAVIQMNPRSFLTSIPEMHPSSMQEDMYRLLRETDESDAIHDVIFKVGGRIFAAHRFILSACKMEALDLQLNTSGRTTIELPDIHPKIFDQFLLYVYTGSCDLVVCQKCPTELEELCKNMRNSNKNNNKSKDLDKNKDPVRLLQDCAKKLGFRSLQKLLEDYYFHDGYIKCRSEKRRLSKIVKFDRNSCPELHDVVIKAKNNKELKAHKCILVARMEYFNNLFSLRWTEAPSTPQTISLSYSHTVIDHLLQFLYADELPAIENEDIESVCNLLILADEYFIGRLKQICEYVLSTHVTLRNAAQMFAFANTYNARQLSRCCMEFLSLNLSAVLESRCLEDLDEGLLKDLTEFYGEWNPVLQRRVITPYSTAPDDEIVLGVSKNRSFMPESKGKSVRKKRQRSQRPPKLADSDKENSLVKEDVPLNETSEEVVEVRSRDSPTAPVRIQAIHSALKQIEVEPLVTDFVSLGGFPELGSPPNANGMYSRSPKSVEKFEGRGKVAKLSQKQRKRLSSESSGKGVEPPAESPKNPWKIEVSPVEPAQAEAKFSAIVSSERKQKENLFKMMSKPLVYTQKEDKAIEDLYKFYNVENVFDEIITIGRVEMHLVGSPVWVQKQKS